MNIRYNEGYNLLYKGSQKKKLFKKHEKLKCLKNFGRSSDDL